MDLTQVPFEFPGNRERLGDLLLPGESTLAQMLQGEKRVWIIALGGTIENFQKKHDTAPLHFVATVGQWELFVNH
jgi:hypothetical protein